MENHKKNKIYVEIHFENKVYSPYFQQVINELSANPELECFYWRRYCVGLRIKNSIFTYNDKKKIIANLQKLKTLTLDKLINVYNETINVNQDWKSEFSFEYGRRCSSKRALSEYYREPKEIYVVHEQIKKKLIKKNRSK